MFDQNKKLNIPKNFILFGHKYTVVIKKDLFETENCYGNADEDLKLIQIPNNPFFQQSLFRIETNIVAIYLHSKLRCRSMSDNS